jgi:ankyrin repeat protein
MIHPNQTVSFLEQDSTFPTDAVRTQKEVTDYLAWIIGDVLADVVRNIDEAQDSAESNLLLVQEAAERFRRLTNDSEHFLRLELEILEKRIYVVRRGSQYGLEQGDASSAGGKGRPFHQQALEMEKKEMVRLLNSCSRSISPETGSTASGDRLESTRQAINQASGFVFSEETTNSTDKQRSPSTSHVPRYIASKSFVKHRRKMLQDDKEFPKLHRAILYSTEHEARSLFESNNASWKCVDFFKRTIAHIAAEEGRVHLLEDILLEQKETFDTRDAFNLTPPMIAVMHGHLDSCRLLIEAGYDREVRDSSGRNLLSIACRRGHYHIVQYLVNDLEFPVNDDRSGYSCSPIHDAIESGNLETCRFLADFGADLITPFKRKLPRDLALEKAQNPILDLINKKAEDALVAAENSSGALPLLTGFPSGSIPRYGMVNNSDHLVHQPYPLGHQMPDMTPYATDTFGYPYPTYQNLDNQLHAPHWNG